ncbi:peptidase S41 family protein-like protein [Zopfia rhizophila CBS 207.26]|uniref:Peptidase S41 family protein-like protein n=1 Tax=Zopfia rhizophila CBS 207.26 TaxID=1314779 RepID=A0A6A6DWM8_9PEZI|nr:peptidase S41 family protein-like protein [Zopfia rhizophila CBS 207.26]
MRLSALLTVTGLLTLATATPVAMHAPLPNLQPLRTRQDNTTNTTAPCAQVSQAIYGQADRPPTPTVPAKIAYECIQSVPLNVTSAKLLLKDIRPYIEWQSTLTVLKNPPAEYVEKVQPAVDIIGGLEKIGASVDSGQYKSEYEFGWALYTLLQSAHDGHFTYVPDSVGTIFTWGRTVPLVSVSEDGKKLPSVFAFEDILGTQFKNISYTPSAIVKIDGKDATEFLEALSQYGSLQDRDALYNNVFYELAQVSLSNSGAATGMFTGGGRGRWVYPGPTTTLTFANGSSTTIENYARVLQNFRDIQTGEDLAAKWFYYASTGDDDQPVNEDPSTGVTAPGYPNPVVPGPNNLINGFYIDAPGYENVAVLQVPNFVGDQSAEVDFQKTTKDFLPKAVADGKTKLIIDLQANGGGTILQGYDMFKQLFPTLEPYGANRFRAHESVDLIGQSFSAFGSQFPRVDTKNQTIRSIQATYFDYHSDTDVDGKPFTSWADKYGPIEQLNDKYTNLARWNLSDVHTVWNSGGIYVTGYGPLSNNTKTSPFKAEDIVILTDGYCASTCTIFSELMKQQAGVKTIAMGGRSNKNPIQAIGGVKGTNNYQWGYIQSLAQQAKIIAPADQKDKFNNSVLSAYASDIPYQRAASNPGVNVRDGLRQNDTSGIPLQFVYEEADCRLYYTPEMTVDITAVWKAAANAQWGGKGNCVGGGGYGKREADEVTTSLKRRRVNRRMNAAVLKQFQAFEKSFSLETECKMNGDGFMRP